MLRPSHPIEYPPAAAVIFFADGLAQGVLRRMLAAGELPNIDRIFARGGVEVQNAIVSLPSLTYANATSLITGLFPGHHGILGNQWFDPATLEARDYGGPLTYRNVNRDIHHPTIYDLLHDQFTLNLQCHTRKGVKHTIDQDISSGILWALGRYETVDRRVGDVLPRVERVIQKEGRWPILWMNYFPGLDEIGHRSGPDSPQYASAVRNIDRQVGRIAEFAAEKAGIERLFFTFVTDHGMAATLPGRGHGSISALRLSGMKVADRPQSGFFGNRSVRLDGLDVVAFIGTDRSVRLHLRGSGGWGERASEEQTQRACMIIRQQPLRDTKLLCRRISPNCVEIQSHSGAACVVRRTDDGKADYCYEVTDGHDPLEYSAEPQIRVLRGGWISSRMWLEQSAAASIPDFVPQIVEMFDSPRAGDVVLFARDGWSYKPRFVAGHGGCLADDMRVTHFYAGPGLPAGGKVHAARLVDVMPTLLDLLGKAERLSEISPIDGVSLRGQLESALPRLP